MPKVTIPLHRNMVSAKGLKLTSKPKDGSFELLVRLII